MNPAFHQAWMCTGSCHQPRAVSSQPPWCQRRTSHTSVLVESCASPSRRGPGPCASCCCLSGPDGSSGGCAPCGAAEAGLFWEACRRCSGAQLQASESGSVLPDKVQHATAHVCGLCVAFQNAEAASSASRPPMSVQCRSQRRPDRYGCDTTPKPGFDSESSEGLARPESTRVKKRPHLGCNGPCSLQRLPAA